MKTKEEIQKMLQTLKEEDATQGPFAEIKNVARIATEQALQWVLEEANSPLT